jgi:peroxiredoxin
MTDDEPVNPAELLFQQLRRSGLPLNAQLDKISEYVEKSKPHYSRAYDQLVARLKRANAGYDTPQKGEQMPSFMLPDEEGHLVRLEKLCESGPVVIAFLRGHWCSYCRLNAAALAGVEKAIAPARIVTISSETGKYAKSLREESGASFPFLTDVGNGYALSIGLSFWLGEELASMLYGDSCDIPAYNGSNGWFLPIPAVFVVGRDGRIKERYVNPDFRHRMEIDALRLAALAASASDR